MMEDKVAVAVFLAEVVRKSNKEWKEQWKVILYFKGSSLLSRAGIMTMTFFLERQGYSKSTLVSHQRTRKYLQFSRILIQDTQDKDL
jgi:hypothetical protein